MGTSSSYNGISGNTNLLPEGWLDDNILSDLIGPPKNTTGYTAEDISKAKGVLKGNISKTKGSFTRSYNNRSKSSVKKALKSYKHIYGGQSGYVKHLSSYSKSINDIGLVLNKLHSEGKSGVEYLNIDTSGKTTKEVLLEISLAISPNGSTKEETVIRNAVIQTMSELETLELDSERSDIDAAVFNDIMKQYLSNLVLCDIETYMGTNLDKLLPTQRADYEIELKNCIDVQVHNEFQNFDFNNDYSKEEINEITNTIIEKLASMFDEGDTDD